MSVAALDSIAGELLSAATAGLALATTGRPPPSSSYVSHGPPTGEHCCDDGFVTVHLDHLEVLPAAGDYATPQLPCSIVTWAQFVVTLGRCVPTLGDGLDSTSVAPADLDSAAGDLLEDLWAMWTELIDRQKVGTLVASTACRDVRLGDAVALEEQGACAGWTIPVSVLVNDAGPTGS